MVISCFDHTDDITMNGGPLVQNKSFSELLYAWYFDKEDSQDYKYVDDCGDLPCNDYCKKGDIWEREK